MNRIPLLALALLLSVPARAYDTIRFLEPIKGDEMVKAMAAAAAADRLYVVDEKKNSLFETIASLQTKWTHLLSRMAINY